MSTTKYKGKQYKRYKVKVIKTICECAGSIFFMAALISLIALDDTEWFIIYLCIGLIPLIVIIRCKRMLRLMHGEI